MSRQPFTIHEIDYFKEWMNDPINTEGLSMYILSKNLHASLKMQGISPIPRALSSIRKYLDKNLAKGINFYYNFI
jgi:hypothetical protein